MKTLLAKLAPRKAIGVYLGEDEVAISQVAATPLGTVEIARRREPCTPDQVDAVLERLLATLPGPRNRQRLLVTAGLPTQRVFFSTRPIRTSDTDASPQVLLHEVLQSPATCIDDMVVDVVKAQPARRQVASIVSCRKKYLSAVLASLHQCGLRPFRVEPAPCALLRAARAVRAPRRARMVLRIFLGDRQGLAVVTAAGLPLIWRSFGLAPGDEVSALHWVTRSLQTVLVHCGVESPLEAVMVHGRTDVSGRLDVPQFQDQLGIPLLWSRGPSLDGATIAYGLALGCLDQQADTFDLGRSLKTAPAVRDIFPWGELALQGSLLVCLALFLSFTSRHLKESCRVVQAENAQSTWLASVSDAELEKEKKELRQKVESMHRFLGTRVVWTSYTQDLTSRLPANASLTVFQGLCELEPFGKQKEAAVKPKKSLILHAEAPIPPSGSTPEEIDRFLGSLRGHPLLQRDFPLVELADIKWSQGNVGARPTASFTVVCLPRAAKSPPRSAQDKGDGPGVEN